eukprot:5681225-Alexandrium_andersonii.AAC.1
MPSVSPDRSKPAPLQPQRFLNLWLAPPAQQPTFKDTQTRCTRMDFARDPSNRANEAFMPVQPV